MWPWQAARLEVHAKSRGWVLRLQGCTTDDGLNRAENGLPRLAAVLRPVGPAWGFPLAEGKTIEKLCGAENARVSRYS